jgi:hypothetical protein
MQQEEIASNPNRIGYSPSAEQFNSRGASADLEDHGIAFTS